MTSMTLRCLALLTLFTAIGPVTFAQSDAAAWAQLDALTPSHVYPPRGRLQRSPEPNFESQLQGLQEMAAAARGTKAEAAHLFYMANAQFRVGSYANAIKTLEDIKKRLSSHPLCQKQRTERGEEIASPVDLFLEDCRSELEIRKVYTVQKLPHAVLDETSRAVFHTTFGDFEVQFFKDVAPKAVANFRKLVESGYYNETYFHRVQNFRLIEGGCPNTREPNRERNDDGAGGPNYTLPLELSDAMHNPGAISMRKMRDGATVHGSQFTICVTAQPQLNNVQSPMGMVTKGMEVVRRIAKQRADDNGNPFDEVRINGTEWK